MTTGLLKQIIMRIWRHPRYLGFLLKNVFHNWMKTHSPSLYRYLYNQELDLGSARDIQQLHVIMRSTDQVMSINAARHLEDIGITTRNDVIRMGGCSLFKAAGQFAKTYGRENIRITLVADHLSDAGMQQFREAAEAAGMTFDVMETATHGNAASFQQQIDMALQDTDDTLAFILEDDYLLYEDALTICFRVMRDHQKVIGMNPHFHPDRVRRQDIGLLAAIHHKLYARVYNTCCTFLMPVKEMRHYEKYLRAYEGWEDSSINYIWKKGICLSPLGWTMAEALHRSELSPVNTLLEHDT